MAERVLEATAAGRNEVHRCPGCGTLIIKVPALQCLDCGTVHPLRAFHYKSGSTYVAECVDLDLISEGSTPASAIERLQQAMVGYLSVAFEGDTKGLVLRPSPVSHWIRYYWHVVKRRILRHDAHVHLLTYEPSGRFQHCP